MARHTAPLQQLGLEKITLGISQGWKSPLTCEEFTRTKRYTKNKVGNNEWL